MPGKMFDKCDYIQCSLMGIILVIVIIMIVAPKENFDTSVATRGQVGDSTNVDTVVGTEGTQNGDVYNCGAQINTVNDNHAWSWVDSADANSALDAANVYGSEGMMSSPPMLKNIYVKQPFMVVPSQYPIYNSTKVEQFANSKPVFRESMARDYVVKPGEGFMTPSRLSEQSLSVLLPGGSISHFRPARIVS